MKPATTNIDLTNLAQDIKRKGKALGFQQLGITATNLEKDEAYLLNWLKTGRHGEMDYMEHHGVKRSRPEALVPGTIRIISARMDYLPADAAHPQETLNDPVKAYVSRYATGRDYHKIVRNKLQALANHIENTTGKFGYRAFVDSAPVLEKALARNAGLGWLGKHTNLINPKAGS